MQKKAKVMKSKVTVQKWLWWSDNGKIITTIQVNCGASSNWELAPKFTWIVIESFCHFQTTKVTSGLPPLISQLFIPFFYSLALWYDSSY